MLIEIAGRQALILEPAEKAAITPTVLVFHGHGGSPEGAAKSIPIASHWPEARVVYPQGLLTPSRTDPEGKRTGWQKALGDQDDRDLRLVDALLEEFSGGPVFATGHSNGGSFCYLLWALRSGAFAGFAPSGTSGHRLKAHADRLPRPIFHIAGRKDFVVPFASQEKAVAAVREFNGCQSSGEAWDDFCTFYPGANPVAAYLSERGHDLPKAAIPHLIRFFRMILSKNK